MEIMMNIEIKKTYYFNNRPVIVLREENEDFVFVAAHLKLDHDITGSNFCIPCNTDGYYHTCEQAGDVIEAIMENIEDQDCFWVAKRYLREHPFEYKECTRLKEQIEKLKEDKKILNDSIKQDSEYRDKLTLDIQKADSAYLEILNKIDFLKEQQNNLLEENRGLKESIQSTTTVKNTNIVISADKMLSLLKSDIILRYLQQGGVDNWEWYGENFPDDINVEVMEEFKSLM